MSDLCKPVGPWSDSSGQVVRVGWWSLGPQVAEVMVTTRDKWLDFECQIQDGLLLVHLSTQDGEWRTLGTCRIPIPDGLGDVCSSQDDDQITVIIAHWKGAPYQEVPPASA